MVNKKLKIALIKPTIGTKLHSLYVDEGRMEPLPLGVLAGLLTEYCEVSMFDDRMESINYEGKFDINATSGDIKSELLTYNDYTIDVTSGDIELENINSLSGKATSGDVEIKKINSYINFKTTSGDIEIDDLTLTRDSSIKVTSGDVTIDKCTNAYINTSVKSGDIDVNKNDRHAEYELKITTTSGDIEVN